MNIQFLKQGGLGGAFSRMMMQCIPLLCLLALSGCDVARIGSNGESKESPGIEVVSASRSSKLTITNRWKQLRGVKTKDGDLYGIQVGMRLGQASVLVLEEPMIDFGRNFGINEYTDLTLGFVKREVKHSRVFSGPFNVVVGGMPGRQHVIHGELDGIKVVLLHTTLMGHQAFYQVVAGTLPSKLEKEKEELLKIVRSFREI